MWNPATLLDRRAYLGMGVAMLVGLACGGAMKPVLKVSNGPEGPQLLMPVSATRSLHIDDRMAFDSYRFGLPDFVIGTDWLNPFDLYEEASYEDAVPEPEPEPAEDVRYVHYDSPAPPLPVATETFEAPPAEPAYPSTRGDILAGIGPPPAAEAPPAPEPAETAILVLPAA